MANYRDSGVNIEAGELLVKKIKSIVKETNRKEVLGGLGGFGALFEIPRGYNEPVLVAGSDGVGTKLQLAFMSNDHSSIGIDLVAMSVNDILVQGAEPLFFLDYFSCGKLSVDVAEKVIQGIVEGCKYSGCSLIGGETAEMPGMYNDGEYDLAGFAVGIVEKSKIVDGSKIVPGDRLLGLASSGLHSNGYSLARFVLKNILGKDYVQKAKSLKLFDDSFLLDLLMRPTKIYVNSVQKIFKTIGGEVHGIVHITGGGLLENIPRVLSPNLKVVLNSSNWVIPNLMKWLKNEGDINNKEFFRVFNAGIGMVLIVSEQKTDIIKNLLTNAGENVYEIGEVIASQEDGSQIEII
jgi:phosphoribosylformylglycinamidine cyclo-ligase